MDASTIIWITDYLTNKPWLCVWPGGQEHNRGLYSHHFYSLWTPQTSSTSQSPVICRNTAVVGGASVMNYRLQTKNWWTTSWRSRNTSVFTWTTDLARDALLMLSTRKHRADFTSWGSLAPSMFAARCYASSIILLWRVQSHLRSGGVASEPVTSKSSTNLIKKADSVLGTVLEPLELTIKRRINLSVFSQRLLQIWCNTDRYRRCFLPTAITIYCTMNLWRDLNNDSYASS